MPPRKTAKLIMFPTPETSLEPPPAAPQLVAPKSVEITRSISRNCLPGVRRRLFLEWVGSHGRRVEYRLAHEYGVGTEDVMRMVREEAREQHRQLFFSRKAA